MAKIRSFIKQEIVLCIAFIAALISMFPVPIDKEYFGYIDMRTLALLYCLMVVVAGIRKAGTFSRMAHVLCSGCSNTRTLSVILVALSFFSAMFITNDVALLTFVPFAVAVLSLANQEGKLIRVVVLQTVAANLGSMLTPVGNPQNIYIQSYYSLDSVDFLKITFPIWAASFVFGAILCFTVARDKLDFFLGEKPILRPGKLVVYSLLFVVCLLSVVRVLEWPYMLAIVVGVLLVYDRRTLIDADFMLLLTFVCFFVFSGNLARMDIVDRVLRSIMQGREYLVSLAASQVISNVPAALLLSGFTDNSRQLLLGVNVGGLGTPIASLASLISLKLYSHSDKANMGKYLLEFTIVNVVLLAALSALALFI